MAVTFLISEDEVKTMTDISANVDASKFRHWIPIVQGQHIKNAIGNGCYKDLLDQVKNDTLTPANNRLLNGDTTDDGEFEGIKKALAWGILWKSYPNLHSTIFPTTVGVKTGENHTALDAQALETRRLGAKEAFEYYLDQVICFMIDNNTDYPCKDEDDTCCDDPITDGYGSSGIVTDTDRSPVRNTTIFNSNIHPENLLDND